MSNSQISSGGEDSKECCTLYFGNLHPYVSQKSLEDLSNYFGENTCKVIKDKVNGTSAGFGFVKYRDKKAAEDALLALNGKCYMGQELRVNWALPNSQKEDYALHHLFVGDLHADVTDAQLYNAFCRCSVGQCSDARVMWDHSTGRSKGYGFVSFRTKEDAARALAEMNGVQIGSRRIRCGWAQHKQDGKQIAPSYGEVDRMDPMNCDVYIGNIAPDWSDADLNKHFSAYGCITEVKLYKKGGYGFVKFLTHDSAVKAIVDTCGKDVGGRMLKCSWGKSIIPSQSGGLSQGTSGGVMSNFMSSSSSSSSSSNSSVANNNVAAGYNGLLSSQGQVFNGLSKPPGKGCAAAAVVSMPNGMPPGTQPSMNMLMSPALTQGLSFMMPGTRGMEGGAPRAANGLEQLPFLELMQLNQAQLGVGVPESPETGTLCSLGSYDLPAQNSLSCFPMHNDASLAMLQVMMSQQGLCLQQQVLSSAMNASCNARQALGPNAYGFSMPNDMNSLIAGISLDGGWTNSYNSEM